MKKLLIATLLSLALLTGCSAGGNRYEVSVGDKEAKSQVQDKNGITLSKIAPPMELIEFGEVGYVKTYYVYDRETKVEYIINYTNYNSEFITFTQLVNPNGTPKLYKGE